MSGHGAFEPCASDGHVTARLMGAPPAVPFGDVAVFPRKAYSHLWENVTCGHMTSDHMTMQSCDTDCTVPAPAVQRTPGSSSLDSAAQVRLSMPVFPFYYILTLDSAAQHASWNVSIAWARAA